MSHSNSSLNCFLSCPYKYKLSYIDKVQPDKVSPHLIFGTMAHEVLYNAGVRRDNANDGVIEPGEYNTVIPSEVLYNDLKEFFGINSWESYFTAVIKQVAKYEEEVVKDFQLYRIYREVKLQITPGQFFELFGKIIDEPLVGVVDFLAIYDRCENAIILDYKFSTGRKTQDDFDMNSQLYIYALLVNVNYNVPIRNIKVGYIDIPKKSFDKPILLSNGTLSRAKSQNVSAELYKKSVIAVHGNDPYYNCDEGGYYYDIYQNLTNNKAAYMSTQYLDIDTYNAIINDVKNTAYLIDKMKVNDLPFCRKYDSYSCKSCDLLNKCKTWLQVNSEEL